MILRKPYAFLIKYFKIIHIILFLIFTYLVFAIRNIYMFFVNYVKNDNFTYLENMASKYMSTLILFLSVLIIAFGVSVYLLMKKKQKPILFYKILIIYGIVLLIFWFYFHNFFATLDKVSYDSLTIIIYRDITAFIYYINFFYVGFSFIRGFGFDIKKFSFDKDKKELHIEETDDEEYELSLGVDKDKVTNYIRRERREFRYYLKENKGTLIVLLIALIIGSGIYIYKKYFVENIVFNENDQIMINNTMYSVNSSMITNLNKYSEIISNKAFFLIINMDIINSENNIKIDKDTLRVNINEEYYYPVFDYNDSFNDIGLLYNEDTIIKSGIKTNVNIIYKINNDKVEKYYLGILNKKGDDYQYEKVLINPYKQIQEKITKKIGDAINIDNYVINILDYSFMEKTDYEYEKCDNGNCDKLIKMVIPKLNYQVLALEIDKLSEIDNSFIENYLGIEYQLSNGVHSVSSKDISIIDIHNNTLYLNVPKSVNKDNLRAITIKTRTNQYSIEMR